MSELLYINSFLILPIAMQVDRINTMGSITITDITFLKPNMISPPENITSTSTFSAILLYVHYHLLLEDLASTTV